MKLKSLVALAVLIISACKKEDKKIDDFSHGVANRDPLIEEGLNYLEQSKSKEAIKFFEELGRKNSKHCGYLIGLPLAQTQEYLKSLNSIINFVSSAYSGISSSPPPSRITTSLSEYCDPSFDNIVRNFVKDLYFDTRRGVELVEKAMEQGCEMVLSYPLSLSIGNNFSIYIALDGRFSDTELQLMSYVGYWVMIISAALLSHDFSINSPAVLSNITKIDGSNITGTIRTLAFAVAGCGSTFSFHSEDKKYIFDIPEPFVRWAASATSFIKSLESRNNKEEYVVSFKDNSGEGKLGYYPEQTTPDLVLDEIKINVKGKVSVGNLKAELKAITVKIPYIITTDFITEATNIIKRMRDIVSSKKTGCPENCISIADINFFLRALNAGYFEDFLRIDLMKYFENPKPLREILPYWFYSKENERWEFMIEAEVAPSRKDLKYYLFNYDAPHFENPLTINFYGQEITSFSIPQDCVSMKDVPLDWMLSPYLLFQDPSISNTFYANLRRSTVEFCSVYEAFYDSEDWKPTNQYMINKSIAIISAKAGSIINPLTNLILESIRLVE
ncbi:MAG: hypothetical protein N2254_05705 [bacterium]|nr:hypothetical protein [bacterium]